MKNLLNEYTYAVTSYVLLEGEPVGDTLSRFARALGEDDTAFKFQYTNGKGKEMKPFPDVDRPLK